MIRKIVNIDEEKCTGCGLCAKACHENAIVMVNGKAKLIKDDFCDGFGDCLPACPAGAITITEREASAYDEAAVEERKKLLAQGENHTHGNGCPGSKLRQMSAKPAFSPVTPASSSTLTATSPSMSFENSSFVPQSQLTTWPVQIKLLPPSAPFYDGANLLIAADCTAYAYANFHQEFIRGKVCLIGCPKLDQVDYTDKLTQIIANNNIKSVTIVRMEVPCCGGLQYAAEDALKASGKFLPWRVVTISIEGKILED